MQTRILFFGTPEFSIPALAALHAVDSYQVAAVVTQPDRPSGRGKRSTPSPVKQFALEHSIPVLQPHSVKQELSEFLSALSQLQPIDCGVVVAFGQILPQEVLAFPTHGCVNIHASLLPRWRGAAPMQHAILAGDTETGVCIMQMEAGLDTGPVYSQRSFQLSDSDTLETVHDRLSTMGAELLLKTLPEVLSGTTEPIPQARQGATYASKIEGPDARIDWNRSAEEIARRIRAFCPVPGAFCMFEGKRMKIFSARPCSATLVSAAKEPGEITYCDSSHLEIQCGSGVLQVQEVQLEGKRRMPVSDFLRGAVIDPTMRFD